MLRDKTENNFLQSQASRRYRDFFLISDYETRMRIFQSILRLRDRDFHFIILMFRDEIEITYCYSHVLRRERETEIEFLTVER